MIKYIKLIYLFSLFLLCGQGSAIMNGDASPWKRALNIDNDYENELKAKYPEGAWFLNLGPTGIRAKITEENPTEFEVMYVFQDSRSPAKGKVNIGDIIVGANGNRFVEPHIFGRRGEAKGWNGPMMDLSKEIEKSQAGTGILSLMIGKHGSKISKNVEIQLKVVGKFAPTYPYNCPRSEKLAKELCDYLADQKNFGRVHTRTHALLALMANGYKEHERVLKEALDSYTDNKYDPLGGGFQTWNWGYDGILMGEYSLLYKTDKFKKAMESVAKAYPEGSKRTGTYTHRSYAHLDATGGKPYASIAAISGLAMTAMSIFKQGGYYYDEEFYNIIHQKYLNNATDETASIAYAFGNNAPNKNREGIEPRHAIIKLKDPKKGLSGKGPGYYCPTGMKNIGEYEIIWPTKADPRWKPTDWIKEEAATNKLKEVLVGNDFGEGSNDPDKEDKPSAKSGENHYRQVERNHPDYKEPTNPEPKKPYTTTKGGGHPMPSGLGTVAHLIGNIGNKPWEYLGKHSANSTALSYEYMFSGHGGANLHAFWSVIGANFADQKEKQVFLNYAKSFLIMSQTHYGPMIVQPWGRDRGFADGDPFYGPILLPTATAAMLLALPKKRLMITGAFDGVPAVASNSTSTKKSTPVKVDPTPTIRRPEKLNTDSIKKLNTVLLGTLVKMDTNKELKPLPLKISKSAHLVELIVADGEDLTFQSSTNHEIKAKLNFYELSDIDRANLSMLIVALKPESKTAQALASIYLENFVSAKAADQYLKNTTEEVLSKIETHIKEKK